jgi:signal transduction histidine kinase
MRPYKNWPVVRWMREHRFAVDVMIAVGIAAFSLVVHFTQHTVDGYEYRHPTVWTVPLVFAASVPLIWRRTHAIPVAFAVFGLQALIEILEVNGPSWIPVAFAFYALGSWAHGSVRLRSVCGLTAAVCVFLVLGLFEDRDDFTIWVALGALVWLMSAFVVGDNMRRRRTEIAELAERAERAERERELLAGQRVTEERARIARELHDIVAHSVSVIVIQATAARRNLGRDLQATETLLDNIENTGRQTMGELRQILGVLRDSAGSTAPMGPMLCDLDALATSIPDLDVRLTQSGSLDDVPIGVALAAYRVVQEALTNAHRHAGPNVTVEVEVASTSDRVGVRVSDNGRGASTRPDEADGGYGLIGMSERVAAFGGTLATGPRRNGGWEVKATFPLDSPSPTRQLTSPVREFAVS